jgi:hypothetical protein
MPDSLACITVGRQGKFANDRDRPRLVASLRRHIIGCEAAGHKKIISFLELVMIKTN